MWIKAKDYLNIKNDHGMYQLLIAIDLNTLIYKFVLICSFGVNI